LVANGAVAQPPTREAKVRDDRQRVEAEGYWIYNDLEKGFLEAEQRKRPLLVVLRCIPCEECVKLDDELLDKDPRMRSLLDQFVRVRQVSTNGLDLGRFQFDTDQSFAVFMFHADKTCLGRYGTRSDQKHWTDDVSLEGLAKALEGGLRLHADFPAVRASLQGKTGAKMEFPVPEDFPIHRGKYGPKLDYSGNVVKSCIHCHQIGDAQRQWHRQQTGTIPDATLFPYPHPKSLGLVMNPAEMATVLRVQPKSWAAKSGLKEGDVIERLDGQPILSMADIQWVLHGVNAEGGQVDCQLRRQGKVETMTWVLPAHWRRQDDIGWRASSWELRRMGLGGLYSKPLGDEQRKSLDIPEGQMGLEVAHVGAFPPHDVAKKAGFQKGDVLLSFDGRNDLQRETDLLRYALNEVAAGTAVAVEILREGRRQTLTLPIPTLPIK
jgi:hypothetical protein